jgi:AraC-like DNA-binding protein
VALTSPAAPPRVLVVSSRVETLVGLRCVLRGWLAGEAVSSLPHLRLAMAMDPPDAILLAGARGALDGLADAVLARGPACPLLLLTECPPGEAMARLEGPGVAGVFPLRQLEGPLRSLECLFERRSPGISRPVARALGTVMAGWSERATVRELAVEVGVSDSHLAHRFRAELGISVRQLLLEIRIEKAVRFLVETDHTMQRVARLSGFTDAAHLCRTLGGHLGRRPGEVRRERWRALRCTWQRA